MSRVTRNDVDNALNVLRQAGLDTSSIDANKMNPTFDELRQRINNIMHVYNRHSVNYIKVLGAPASKEMRQALTKALVDAQKYVDELEAFPATKRSKGSLEPSDTLVDRLLISLSRVSDKLFSNKGGCNNGKCD